MKDDDVGLASNRAALPSFKCKTFLHLPKTEFTDSPLRGHFLSFQ